MKRANLGCGSIQPEGWDNIDIEDRGQEFFFTTGGGHDFDGPPLVPGVPHGRRRTQFDGRSWLGRGELNPFHDYDYIVCNHMLSDIGHHDLVPALKNIRSMLREGGVLRILVPNLNSAIDAFESGDESWFPQDERTGDIHAKFCTFLTWFGESRSVFTSGYLLHLLIEAGFSETAVGLCHWTPLSPFPEITSLDDRCTQALIVEARK